MLLFLFRFFGRSAAGFGPPLARFFCRFHLKNKLRSHVVIQFDRYLVFAGVFDWALKENFMPVNFGAEFVFDTVHNILRGNGSKRLPGLAGLEREDEPSLTDSARQFFCLVQFAGFALGALLLQRIDLTQGARSDFMCLSVRQKIIACIAPTHFDYVRLGTQTGNVFRQDKFSQRHIDF